jgi:hypothetical protein
MTAYLHTCDRCHEPIRQGRLMLGILAGRPPVGASESTHLPHPIIDLCPSCASALEEWLSQAPEHATA